MPLWALIDTYQQKLAELTASQSTVNNSQTANSIATSSSSQEISSDDDHMSDPVFFHPGTQFDQYAAPLSSQYKAGYADGCYYGVRQICLAQHKQPNTPLIKEDCQGSLELSRLTGDNAQEVTQAINKFFTNRNIVDHLLKRLASLETLISPHMKGQPVSNLEHLLQEHRNVTAELQKFNIYAENRQQGHFIQARKLGVAVGTYLGTAYFKTYCEDEDKSREHKLAYTMMPVLSHTHQKVGNLQFVQIPQLIRSPSLTQLLIDQVQHEDEYSALVRKWYLSLAAYGAGGAMGRGLAQLAAAGSLTGAGALEGGRQMQAGLMLLMLTAPRLDSNTQKPPEN